MQIFLSLSIYLYFLPHLHHNPRTKCLFIFIIIFFLFWFRVSLFPAIVPRLGLHCANFMMAVSCPQYTLRHVLN